MNTPSRRSVLAGLAATLVLGLSASGISAAAAPPTEVRAAQAQVVETSPGSPYRRTELYFGSSRPDGSEVTPEEFERFVDKEVTPRFPGGLTVLTGRGQWRYDSGEIAKETSHILVLFYPPADVAAGKAIEEIRADYKRRYDQESVLRADSVERVSF